MAPRRSPNHSIAIPTLTIGSTVDTIDAVEGPIFGRPARKALIGSTVEARASATIQPQPADAKPRCSEPLTSPAAHTVAAAPVAMSALRWKGSIRRVTPSATRM